MAFWKYREELSQIDRLKRSYYELLRDQLDQILLQYALIDSFENFRSQNLPFPFVEKRELKPRARIPDQEYDSQNAFLVIFVEDVIRRILAGYREYAMVPSSDHIQFPRARLPQDRLLERTIGVVFRYVNSRRVLLRPRSPAIRASPHDVSSHAVHRETHKQRTVCHLEYIPRVARLVALVLTAFTWSGKHFFALPD